MGGATSRRRVLLVGMNLQQGGTERQIVHLARALEGTPWGARLCLTAGGHYYEGLPQGEPSYQLDPALRPPQAERELARIIDDFRPHVVHSFRDCINQLTYRALRRTQHRPAWLPSVRGRPVLPSDLLRIARFSGRAFKVTTNSVGIARSLALFARIPSQRIALVHNLIDEQAFQPPTPAERQAARQQLRLPGQAFVWVLPGRISLVKNQFGLVYALRLLRASEHPHAAVVVLAGRVRDRVTAWLLPRWIRLAGVSQDVRMPGPLCARTLYAAADALVLPSWAEGMSNALLEGQLCGLPVVVSHQANRDLIVESGQTGFEVVTGCARPLASGMRRIMELASDERRLMGLRGRARVLERFDRAESLRRVLTLYEEAAASLG
jgi:glycosyltransferase involved in cell wall biosynthesis